MPDPARDRHDQYDDQEPRGPVFPPIDLAGEALRPTPAGEWRNFPEEPSGPPTLDQAMRRAAMNVLTGALGAFPPPASPHADEAARPIDDRSGAIGLLSAATAAPNQFSKGVQGQVGPDGLHASIDRWMDEVR